jgi:hypothetical protein
MSSKAQVLSNNTNSFPNNNSGQITPQVLRDFNDDFINSVQFTDTPTPTAVSASFAQTAATAVSASYAANADLLDGINSSAFVLNSQTASMSVLSSSFALTASFALNAGGGTTVNTGSLLVTASAAFSTITFTKGDGSTFDVTVAQSGSVATASLALDSERLGGVLPSGYVTTSSTSSFATKAELNAYTASTNTFTSSIQTQVNALQAATSSYVQNSQTSSMSVLSASFAITASYALNAGTTVDTGSFVTTSSFNAFSSSVDSQLTALENFSSSLDATFATDAQLNAYTASNNAALSALSSSYIATSGSVNQLLAFSSSLDATFATDAQLTALSSSIALTDATQSAQIAALEQFSSSLDATYATDAQLNAATASLSASLATSIATKLDTTVFNAYTSSNDSKVNALTAATSSYVQNSQTSSMSVASASVATSASFASNAATAANATSASYATNADTAQTATSASYSNNSTSASYALNASTADSATSASFATNAATASNTTSASFASTSSFTPNALVTASASNTTITFTKGDGTTFDVTVSQSGSVATASLALNSELLDGLDSTAFVLNSQTSSMSVASASVATSASFASNAATAANATSASFASNAAQATSASFATSASYALNAGNALTATSASYATTAGFAQTIASGLNITASNILVNNNLTVLGTASFAYTKTTTGSAVIIGDEFIILNADTPTAPFAGIKVYDTGSASTASLEWNGNGDYWIQVDEAGDSAAMLTGASGSKGSEVFPTANRLIKGTGNSTVVDSSISDNGSIVSINSNTQVTGSLTVSSNITGSNLRVENNTHLDGQLRVTNDAQFDTHILIQGAQPHVKLRDTSGGGFSSGYDVRVDTGSFEIYDDTHDRNVLSDIFDPGTGKHTTILSSEIVVISGSDSVTVLGPLTASLFGTASFATSASYSLNADLLDGKDSTTFATTSSNTFVGNQTITGSVSILDSASALQIVGNGFGQSSLISPNGALVLTPGLYGVQINGAYPDLQVNGNITSTGTSSYLTGSLLGTASYSTYAENAGAALTATSASYAVSASFATSASFAQNAVSASFAPSTPAFPFTGSAGISGSLEVVGNSLLTGSFLVKPTSFQTTEYPISILEAGDGTSTGGNLISTRSTNALATGSVHVTGSNNFIALSAGVANTFVTNGRGSIIRGNNSIILGAVPGITGSNGSGYNRPAPSFTNSFNAGSVTVTDNRPTATLAPLTFTNNNNNGSITATLSTGSVSLSNNMMFGSSGTIINVTGSTGTARSISANILGSFAGNRIEFDGSGGNIISSMLLGNFLTASFTDTNTTLSSVSVLGYQLAVSGSGPAGGTTLFGSAYVGRWNAIDDTSKPGTTVFAVGTGTSNAARRTSLFVSASGLTTVRDSLIVTGSLTVGTTTPELQVLSTGVTLGNVATDTHTVTGSLSISGSLNAPSITGSLLGTASFADNSTSASYALNATSASFAQTASFYGGTVVSASYALNSTSASYAQTATSASFAVSASWAPTQTIDTGSFATTGSNTFTGVNTFQSTTNLQGVTQIGQQLAFTASRFTSTPPENYQEIELLDDKRFGFNVKNLLSPTSGSDFTATVNSSSLFTEVGFKTYYGGTVGELTLRNTNGVRSLSVIADSTTISGSTTINSLTGSLQGTASYAVQALSASWAPEPTPINTGSFATTGSNTFTGNQTISSGFRLITERIESTSSLTLSSTAPSQITLDGDTSVAIGKILLADKIQGNGGGKISFISSVDITGSLNVTNGITGSLQGTASFATTASYLNTLNQSLVISGSVRGEVAALSISANTASLDLSTNNFFTLTLVSGSNTYINPSNINAGQTINLRVTQANPGSGTVSFPSTVKQVSGGSYVPSTGNGAVDIVTFISFDGSSLYLSNVKNLV